MSIRQKRPEPSEIKKIIMMAAQGHADAQYKLGNLYDGHHNRWCADDLISDNNAEAVKWYRKAAEQGHAAAQYHLGEMYRNGKGIYQDYTEAVNWYRKAAKQGNEYAQYELGWMYLNGKGALKNTPEALKWYRKAAEQGSEKAQNALGLMYECGEGVPQDDEEAAKWFRQAAERGHNVAQYNLAMMYKNGEGVPQDDIEAAKWCYKATEGYHVVADAVKWLHKEAEQGNAEAQYWLGEYYYGHGMIDNWYTDYYTALDWYRKAAEQGHKEAQYKIGAMYEKGEGAAQNNAEAEKWYLKAAEQGHTEAQNNLDLMCIDDKSVSHDDGDDAPQGNAEDVKRCLKAAEQGEAVAQFNLGWKYANGKGVPQDYAEAEKWYRKAAEQGHAAAQYNLGKMYRNGKSIHQENAKTVYWYLKALRQGEAVKWFKKAAEQGHAKAQFWLGWMYQHGRGAQQNNTEAMKWFRKAAEQGDANGQNWLGWMYHYGKGVPQDNVEAVKWYHKAAEQGEAYAQDKLGDMYQYGKGVPQNDEEAVKWYRKAAEQGNALAQNNLGAMYLNGKGVPQDNAEAVKWYRKSAEQGYTYAQSQMGFLYHVGKGVPQNYAEAMKWYLMAAAQGNRFAQCNIGIMYQNGDGVRQDNAEAVKWYRKAAEQGHEAAQKYLDQLKAKGVKVDEAESKPLSEQKLEVATSGAKKKKSSTAGRHLRDTEECKALLNACTPDLYRHNAFRISGIPIDASPRDIKRRFDDLKAAAEMGDLEDELMHAFALNPAPGIDQIREAVQRIQDPEKRTIDEFFWFWPFEPGKTNIDSALNALMDDNKSTAIKIWSDALSDNHGPKSTVAKHNLAVMYHLQALDAEQNALKSDLSAEQLLMISKDWRTCFKWWEELADDETLWSMVADRIRTVDDPRLTTGFARRMRVTLPEAIDKINAMLARDFAEKGKFSQVTDHINYMNETHQGKDDVPKILSIITKPLKERVDSAVERATSTAKKEPAQAAQAAFDLLQAISEPLKVIQTILPPEDHKRIDLCDTVAEACLTCQIAYGRETEDWTKSIEILDSALKYAASKETKERIADNRLNVALNKHLGSLVKKIDKIEESNLSIAEKMNYINTEILPQLLQIKKYPSMTEDVYEKCADTVAHYIRGLSVAEYNNSSNLTEALRILEVSVSIARGRELCEKLREDKAHLINIQKETTKHNLQMQIRSDEIEVTDKYVRYNNRKFSVSSIQGVKYGIFVQVINGVRTSSYLIDIIDRQDESIHIECKRFFRNEAQAKADFNRILEALYHQVIPGLVQRLAEDIISGKRLLIGNCCLTKQGMHITTGALLWKKETLVPFSDLRFNTYSGQISASSVKDKGISTSMAIRDTWNAALLEFITKAVVEMMAKR